MALGTRSYGKMLDYEQYIDHQLGLTRARIKITDVLTAAVTLATAILAVLFLEVVLDHLIGLPFWFRRAVFLAGIVGIVAYAVAKIGRPLFWSVNGFYAARTIEGADPAFKNSLINYLDLRRGREKVPAHFLAA